MGNGKPAEELAIEDDRAEDGRAEDESEEDSAVLWALDFKLEPEAGTMDDDNVLDAAKEDCTATLEEDTQFGPVSRIPPPQPEINNVEIRLRAKALMGASGKVDMLVISVYKNGV